MAQPDLHSERYGLVLTVDRLMLNDDDGRRVSVLPQYRRQSYNCGRLAGGIYETVFAAAWNAFRDF
jgi:hypothetical protein